MYQSLRVPCDLCNCRTICWSWFIQNWLENFRMVQRRKYNTIVNIKQTPEGLKCPSEFSLCHYQLAYFILLIYILHLLKYPSASWYKICHFQMDGSAEHCHVIRHNNTFWRARQIIRYQATATLRRPQKVYVIHCLKWMGETKPTGTSLSFWQSMKRRTRRSFSENNFSAGMVMWEPRIPLTHCNFLKRNLVSFLAKTFKNINIFSYTCESTSKLMQLFLCIWRVYILWTKVRPSQKGLFRKDFYSDIESDKVFTMDHTLDEGT